MFPFCGNIREYGMNEVYRLGIYEVLRGTLKMSRTASELFRLRQNESGELVL